MERALTPLCIYNKHGQTIYASQSFLALLQAEAEDVAFFDCFASTLTPQAVLKELWKRALQEGTVSFLAKTHDGGTSLECSLHFNQATHSMFLTAQKSGYVEPIDSAVERIEAAVGVPPLPSL
ncbi:MAG TPA: hypothetical protein V6C50_09090, partial [Crinalium sp.]